MSFKCAHFADIHFRGLSRHEEYKEVFSSIFNQLKKENLDAIFIGGDIVHSKTQGISPELIEILVWWFEGLADIARVYVILGNHDGLILNKDRQDAISPIIKALNNDNIVLFKNSGNFVDSCHPEINWCVFSCFDERSWKKVKTLDDKINIATYHGPVLGSKVDSDWILDDEDQVTVDFFKDFDFTFLGDIHKFQYLNDKKTVAYPGSTIQQNYGEDLEKGYLIWDIKSRDDYSSKFIQVTNSRSFRTIQWKKSVSETLESVDSSMKFSRFRVRSNCTIPQSEIKQLYNGLKEDFAATEVVFKYDIEESSDDTISIGDTLLDRTDLSSPSTHVKLMNEYTKTFVLNSDERDLLEDLTRRVSSEALKNESRKNSKWSIKKLKFDNTFGYGSKNVIDFDKLIGITGIFGKNRSGKSSIPGSLMYGLFNTTDRGSIKNLHIINSRKGFCQVEVDFNVNGKAYRSERQSVKHTTKAGKTNASTSLNLWKTAAGEKIEDLSGEQRRETEKDLKKLVGTADDFLLTSLASQGGMNTFIRNGATVRKSILTKFLDLVVFENMLNIAKSEFSELKGSMKSAPDRDWATIIRSKRIELENLTSERREVEEQSKRIREEYDSIKLLLATHENSEDFTEDEIITQNALIEKLIKRSNLMQQSILKASDSIMSLDNKIEKIELIKEQFPIEELKEKFQEQKDIESNLKAIEHSLEKERTLLKQQKKLASTLEVVPCGDSYPKCKFIKDSHIAKQKIPDQSEKVSEISSNCSAIKRSLKKILGQTLEDKIGKYEEILKNESVFKLERSSIVVSLREYEVEDTNINQEIKEAKELLSKMKLNASASSENNEITRLKGKLKNLLQRTNFLESEKLSLSEKIGLNQQQLTDLETEREKYSELKKKWNAYNAFMQSVDKKGIPLKIMSGQLPVINSEIEKILHGVVDFTVNIEADDDTNALDVFINYGDSKRIIECASGMEKMLSSLAIRVALINVSNLPKSDLLIIDEGFGALDDGNIEACSRLLVSLKKFFKNILIISHIDAIKDVVDNVLDIQSKGKNSLVVYE